MIKNGKAYCTYCSRIIACDEETKRTWNMNVKLYCARCYCNKVNTGLRWRYYEGKSNVPMYLTWHEAELIGSLLNQSGEELRDRNIQYYYKHCSKCKRVIGSYEIEYPEQIMEIVEQPVFKQKCWVCSCKEDKGEHHIQIVKEMLDHGCGCG